ncbi:hypothetical protein [Limobrevibacterium gyesilva]|uniref:Lipoprotein n=1 Tax=Limobrevibacterium gyesilva TaxID=2991712 RepID=A0AA41YJ24_9PROT|nr:hypothetical protein [Limobrevibacterium gyesilva]MCW3473111.1 hypothetical protein [Limobrevibacterium gyesilva]
MRPRRPAALLLAGLVLTGCTLVDQRTFQRTPPAPTAEDVARARLPPLPLVVIRFDQLDTDYQPALAEAIEAAQARKPDVVFDVLTPIPTGEAREVQERYARQGAEDAAAVANALAAEGVPPDRVHMGYRGDPGTPPREVRVYAR